MRERIARGSARRAVTSRPLAARPAASDPVASDRATRRPGALQRLALPVLLLAALACGSSHEPLQLSLVGFGPGTVRVRIDLQSEVEPGSLALRLDAAPVALPAAAGPGSVTAELAVPEGSHHRLSASARFRHDGLSLAQTAVLSFDVPTPAPPLLASDPAPGASRVPRTAWLRLDFAAPPAPAVPSGLQLGCVQDGRRVERAALVRFLAPATLVVAPLEDLPPSARCGLEWQGPTGRQSLPFETAAAGTAVPVRYDRGDPTAVTPLPDDFWLVDDVSTPTGVRLAIPPPAGPPDRTELFEALLAGTRRLDGWSPLGPLVVELAEAPDPTTLPRTAAESLDPLATVGLFDLAPGAALGSRVPFQLQVRNDVTPSGRSSHSLLILPAVPLAPGGRYGLVVTRRALASPERPLGPSEFFARALAAPEAGEPAEVSRVRTLAQDVLDTIESHAVLPISRRDVALALRVSVRSTDALPGDLLAIRSQVAAAPPPAFRVGEVTAEPAASPVLAIVRGSWDAPDWRDGANLARDAAGAPRSTRSRPVSFTLAVPRALATLPMPLVLYQHGDPGSAEAEVPGAARRGLAAAGFAVIGFTDVLNREIAPVGSDQQRIESQLSAVFGALLANHRLPDYWVETHAEQLAFLRGLSGLDVLPLVQGPNGLASQPDGVPDFATPLAFLGVSEGANGAPALLPYAPEIGSAVLVAGGARLAEVLLHQQPDALLQQLASLHPDLSPGDVWAGVSIFQQLFDAQDGHNHARFLYRDPLAADASRRPASVLLIEGIDDSLVPNAATESLAWALGPIPLVGPVLRPVPFLGSVPAPLRANLGPDTTAGLVQYAPTGLQGIPPTAGCAALTPVSGSEGHYCAQRAVESLRQQVTFLRSALGGAAPVIVDPNSS